jgi:hypothetical protein
MQRGADKKVCRLTSRQRPSGRTDLRVGFPPLIGGRLGGAQRWTSDPSGRDRSARADAVLAAEIHTSPQGELFSAVMSAKHVVEIAPLRDFL